MSEQPMTEPLGYPGAYPGTYPGGYPGGGGVPDPADNLLRHYAGVLQRRWRWVAMGLAIGLVAGILAAVLIKDKPITTRYYKATNTLTLGSLDAADPSQPNVGDYTLNQAALLIQSQQLKDSVATTLGMSADAVAEQVEATVRPNVNAIDVTAISTKPEIAVQLADRSADELRKLAQIQSGDAAAAQRTQLTDERTDLQNQRDQLAAQPDTGDDQADLIRAQQVNELDQSIESIDNQIANLPGTSTGFQLSVLAPANATQINARGYNYRRAQNINARNQLIDTSRNSNSGPDFDELDLSTGPPMSPSTRVLLGGAAGLVLGLIAAFVMEAWDDRVRRRDQVEELTGFPVITEIPELSREQIRDHHLAVTQSPTGVAAERYRAARTAIEFIAEDDTDEPVESQVLVITSPGPSEGKTTTAVNLAASFAQDGKRVLVIDGDFRRPAVRRYLSPTPDLIDPDQPEETRAEGVVFLAGPSDAPSPEAAIDTLVATVEKWRDHYDLVVVDTPPVLTTNDAVGLLASATGVVLVLRAGQTRPRAAGRVAELLRGYRADVLGVVLNSVDKAEMNQYYGYGYGYGYAYHASSKKSGKKAPKQPVEQPDTADT